MNSNVRPLSEDEEEEEEDDDAIVYRYHPNDPFGQFPPPFGILPGSSHNNRPNYSSLMEMVWDNLAMSYMEQQMMEEQRRQELAAEAEAERARILKCPLCMVLHTPVLEEDNDDDEQDSGALVPCLRCA